MSKIINFFFGCVCGAAGLYTAMHFHVVRSNEGHHLIPKAQLALDDTYVDTRAFGLQEWQHHGALAAAIVKADKQDLFRTSAASALENTFQKLGGERR